MAISRGVNEFWTDGITIVGVVRKIRFHFSVIRPDGTSYWYYFGTPKPAGVVGEQQDEIEFPRDFNKLRDVDDELYQLALRAARFQVGIDR